LVWAFDDARLGIIDWERRMRSWLVAVIVTVGLILTVWAGLAWGPFAAVATGWIALVIGLVLVAWWQVLGGQGKTGHLSTLQNRPFPVSGIEAD